MRLPVTCFEQRSSFQATVTAAKTSNPSREPHAVGIVPWSHTKQQLTLEKRQAEAIASLSKFFGEGEVDFCDYEPQSHHSDQSLSPRCVAYSHNQAEDEGESNKDVTINSNLATTYTEEQAIHHQILFRNISLPSTCKSERTWLSTSLPSKSSLKKSSSNRSINRNVSFSNLSIREYNVQLGDNPSCRYGVPISLGWDYEEQESLPLDALEDTSEWTNCGEEMNSSDTILHGQQQQPQQLRRRRKPHELLLSYTDRRRLLKSAGYSREELQKCLKTIRKVQHERSMTELFLGVAPLEDAMETVLDRVSNLWFQPLSKQQAHEHAQPYNATTTIATANSC